MLAYLEPNLDPHAMLFIMGSLTTLLFRNDFVVAKTQEPIMPSILLHYV